MAAPLKPWERNGVNFHNSTNLPPNISFPSEGGGQNTYVDNLSSNYLPTGYGGSRLPPALPPRLNPAIRPSLPFSSSVGVGGYGYSPYSGFAGSSYSSPYGSSYRGFPSFGGGVTTNMDPYGSSIADGGFIQLAEESSRPAFQSIESIVHAVSSVSMMLESTYFAMYSSFRAVIGVAHHFTQMRTQFAQIFSALALIRSLRWLYWKALNLMGLLGSDPSVDKVWANIAKEMNSPGTLAEKDLKRTRSNWPFVMFVAIVFGTPYIIWKILTSVTQAANPQSATNKEWMNGDAEFYVGVAQYDFTAETDREIAFRAGQTMRLAPKELQPRIRGWLLASVDGKRSGLVPANYIRILGKGTNSLKQQQQQTEQKQQIEIPHVSQETKSQAFLSEASTSAGEPSSGIIENKGDSAGTEI